MPTRISVPSNLLQLATSIQNLGITTGSIYLYYQDGILSATTAEQIVQTNNIGYPFLFPDGTQIYSLTPITSIQNIPWLYGYSTLPSGYESTLSLWLDGLESRAINSTSQKIMSKSYATDLLFLDSSTNKFTYSSNCINLTSNAYLQSQNTIAFTTYWKLAVVFSIPTFINNSYIFFTQ
jgi:hypothetical protein